MALLKPLLLTIVKTFCGQIYSFFWIEHFSEFSSLIGCYFRRLLHLYELILYSIWQKSARCLLVNLEFLTTFAFKLSNANVSSKNCLVDGLNRPKFPESTKQKLWNFPLDEIEHFTTIEIYMIKCLIKYKSEVNLIRKMFKKIAVYLK